MRLACKRYLTMLDMAASGQWGFTFSEAHAVDACAFIETLPLAEDNFRGVEFTELEPVQIWILCAIYGFRDEYGHRFCAEAYIEIPRKSAKSVLATGIGLYDIRQENSRKPLVLIAASTLEQANRVFGPMKTIIENDEDLREKYKLEATKAEIRCGANDGTIEKVASIGERQDGWNPTTVILEELHAQNPDVYAVLKSAMGSRGGQLLFQITTAGRDPIGLAWENRKAAIQVLEGHFANWRVFAAIFTVDKEDITNEDGTMSFERVLTDEQLWMKACPMLGVSFNMATFRLLATSAHQKHSERAEFLRTRLNIWTSGGSKVFDLELVRRGADPSLDIAAFKGRKAWIGVDLSTSDDLSAKAVIVEDGDDLILFVNHYAASDAPIFSDPDLMAMCRDWRDRGYIHAEREGRVDHSQIEADIRADCKFFDVQAIGMDPAMASLMMDSLEDDRLPVVKYMNKAHMMTAPMDDIKSRAEAKSGSTVRYDGNPVLEWCFSNTYGEKKKDGTLMPYKESESSLYKIDGVVAACFADGVRLHPEFADKVKKPSVYLRRGLIGVENGKNRDGQGANGTPGNG